MKQLQYQKFPHRFYFRTFKAFSLFLPFFFLQCQNSRDLFIELKTKTQSYGELHLIVPDRHTVTVIAITAGVSLVLYWFFFALVRVVVKYKVRQTLLDSGALHSLLRKLRRKRRHTYLSEQAQKIVDQHALEDAKNAIDMRETRPLAVQEISPLSHLSHPSRPAPAKEYEPIQKREHQVHSLINENEKTEDNNHSADTLDPTLAFFLGQDILSEERRSFIRSYNYQTLQAALRNAPKYQKASLVKNANAKDKKKTYDLFLENTLIGSGRWAHIALRDVRVSPTHARIRKIDSRFVIYDLLSAGGILLNDRKLLRPKALIHGDTIGIGRARFRFRGL